MYKKREYSIKKIIEESFFGVKLILRMLPKLSPLLIYPVISPFILINVVPLNTQYHAIQYVYQICYLSKHF